MKHIQEGDMILGVTGHRQLIHPYDVVYQRAKIQIIDLEPTRIITGMAIGFDTICAMIAKELQIPYIAAVPCDDQVKPWTTEQINIYYDLLQGACDIVNVTPGSYAAWKMFRRDEWIVKHSNRLLAYYDGRDRGGTLHTINYAAKLNVPVSLWSKA